MADALDTSITLRATPLSEQIVHRVPCRHPASKRDAARACNFEPMADRCRLPHGRRHVSMLSVALEKGVQVTLFDDLIRPQQQRRRDERQDADEWECSHCYIPAFLSDAWKKEGGGLVPARRERRVQRPPRGLLHGAPGRWPSGRNLTDPRP